MGASPANAAKAPGTVTGTVTDSGTGVQGIDVSWLVPSSGSTNTVQTDANGKYSLTLPAGTSRYYILVNADPNDSERMNKDYLAEFFGAHNAEGYAFQVVAPRTTRASFSLDAALETGGSVSGTSADLANQPVALEPIGLDDQYGADADASGHFSFTGYAPGKYELYAPSHGTFAAYHSAPIDLQNDDNIVVNPTIAVGAEIEGTLTSPVPLDDLDISVTKAGALGDYHYTSGPAESGRFSIIGLSVGSYTVSFDNTDRQNSNQFVHQSFTAHVSALGQDITHDVTFVTGGTVTGDADDPDGTYSVRLMNAAGTVVRSVDETSGTGFSFWGISPGNYTLGIVDDPSSGYYYAPLTVAAATTDDLGTLPLSKKPLSVSGTVTGGHSGFIRFAEQDPSLTAYFSTQANFGKSGRYKIPSLLPGKYDVYVFVNGRQPGHYTFTVSKSTSKNFSIGHKLIAVKGTVTVQGFKLDDATTYYSSPTSFIDLPVSVSDGKLTASGQSGTYVMFTFTLNGILSNVQENTAFQFAFPRSLKQIKLVTGHTTELGTAAIKLTGSL